MQHGDVQWTDQYSRQASNSAMQIHQNGILQRESSARPLGIEWARCMDPGPKRFLFKLNSIVKKARLIRLHDPFANFQPICAGLLQNCK